MPHGSSSNEAAEGRRMSEVVRLAPDVTLADMRVAPSADGQCLLVYCRDRIVALLCSMGSDLSLIHISEPTRPY
jgi:hypothetical protein